MRKKLAAPEETAQSHSSAKKKSNHTAPKAPVVSLAQPGRLRVAHVLGILGVAHSTLYEGMKSGRYPRPDGRDGSIPYWRTDTIRRFLEA